MKKEDLKKWTRDMLKDKILYQEALIQQRNKDIEIISKRAKELNDENTDLKQRIKGLEDICDGSCFANETDDRDEKIAKMQDRIDSDCVRINRLKITIETLVDMYGLLRKQVGMD